MCTVQSNSSPARSPRSLVRDGTAYSQRTFFFLFLFLFFLMDCCSKYRHTRLQTVWGVSVLCVNWTVFTDETCRLNSKSPDERKPTVMVWGFSVGRRMCVCVYKREEKKNNPIVLLHTRTCRRTAPVCAICSFWRILHQDPRWDLALTCSSFWREKKNCKRNSECSERSVDSCNQFSWLTVGS